MKCQKCDKDAKYHITELAGGKPMELHLCEDHAREYLSEPESEGESEGAPNLVGALAQHLVLGQTAEELAKLDRQTCPICGITFLEFRKQGRLGCPHDYLCFERELQPLIVNIHGESKHVGKHPRRSPASTDQQTELIRLRKELKECVDGENYEQASRIRDRIREIEGARQP